ncbi:MAG: hypothetical protein WC770_07090 [Phycisphaerae bacterium]
MPFIRINGVIGKLYVPQKAGERKHKCKDCYVCQMCSDDRCRQCINRKSDKCRRKNKK